MIRVWRDPRAGAERTILVGLDACVHAMTPVDARRLRDELDEAIAEEPTRRDTPLAIAQARDTDPAPRKPSSSGFAAVLEILDEAKKQGQKPSE